MSPDRLLGFHERWLRATFAPGVETSALSLPRGNAKSATAGRLLALAMTPESALWRPGLETIVVAGSLRQARHMWGFARAVLGDDEYRWQDSDQRIAVTHRETRQVAYVISSNAKKALGLSQFGLVLADEPGSWEVRAGDLMYDALRESIGKLPDQRLVLIGTQAPSEPGSWWLDLLDGGSNPALGIHVTRLAAEPEEPWDSWQTIRRVNPVAVTHAPLRKTVLRRRDEARDNPTKRRKFQAWRLNMVTETVSTPLCEAEAWLAVESRPVPPREGHPFVGLDMGGKRSWTAAWCLWPNGRSECYAVFGDKVSLAQRERMDAMPSGAYSRIAAEGVLVADEGRSRGRPERLLALLNDRGIHPAHAVADRFIFDELGDEIAGGFGLDKRTLRWSEASEDIASFRELVADGPLTIVPECRTLARVGIGQAVVVEDDGNERMDKKRHSRSRDDIAICAVLAAGEWARDRRRPKREVVYHGLV